MLKFQAFTASDIRHTNHYTISNKWSMENKVKAGCIAETYYNYFLPIYLVLFKLLLLLMLHAHTHKCLDTFKLFDFNNSLELWPSLGRILTVNT